MKKVTLGNTGIEVSIVGFGVLPIGPSQLALPVEEGAEIIKYAFRHGINFIDTAQYYRAYPYMSKAFESGEFDNVIICSKSLSDDYDGMMEAIYEARQELNREVIDIFLMHEVRSGQLEERAGAWEALEELKNDISFEQLLNSIVFDFLLVAALNFLAIPYISTSSFSAISFAISARSLPGCRA